MRRWIQEPQPLASPLLFELDERFVPEIATLPDKYLHKPWEASEAILNTAKIVLGRNYPKPIVDHSAAREAALEAFGKTKE